MSHSIHPVHEAGLAVALMAIGLVGIVFATVYGNTTSTPSSNPAASYRGPVLQIKASCRRIDDRLAAHVNLGDIAKIYQPARLTQSQPIKAAVKSTDKKAEPVKTIDTKIQDAKLKLTGIAWSPKCPLAFINGESVMVGDSIHGWKVISITAERVHIENAGGRRRVLMLFRPQTGPNKQPKDAAKPALL